MQIMKRKPPVMTGNRELAVAMQEKRRSHAAGVHDSRPRRQRSRADSKRAAVKDAE
jgi:hypothetical protein